MCFVIHLYHRRGVAWPKGFVCMVMARHLHASDWIVRLSHRLATTRIHHTEYVEKDCCTALERDITSDKRL